MAPANRDIHDYSFSVYWDVYEGMWAAECISIKIGENQYLRDLGNTPEDAVKNFMYLLKLHIDPCPESQERKSKTS